MVQIGKINTLKVNRFVDFGAFLEAGDGIEILLPKRYLTEGVKEGDEIDVFVYNDSEDRLVAVTDRPKAMVGEFALLRVSQVNATGAFLDWGLPKELLVPFREQKVRMEQGRYYVVYIYLDDNTKRIVASAKLDKFVDNTIPHYRTDELVDVLIAKRTDLGYRVIINNLHWGMIYHNEVFAEINIGEHHQARVKTIRRDGKIDLLLGTKAKSRTADLAERLVEHMRANGGSMHITDASTPEEIRAYFKCSKRDFKQAIGHLFKKNRIDIQPDAITLVTNK